MKSESEGECDVNYVQWYDNKVVNIVSTFASSEPLGSILCYDSKRQTKIEVSCPNIIQLYNKSMGGVDLADCLIALYRINIRSKKYYQWLIFHMIDMSIVNAWLLYRRSADHLQLPKKQVMSLALFKLRLAIALMKSGKSCVRSKRGRPSSTPEPPTKRKAIGCIQVLPEPSVRYDEMGH